MEWDFLLIYVESEIGLYIIPIYVEKNTLNLQILATVLFLLYLLVWQICQIITALKYVHFSNDKEEDTNGVAKIKGSEGFGMGKLAKIEPS